jgi:hypothetical protein
MVGQHVLHFDLPAWEIWVAPAVGIACMGLTLMVGRAITQRRRRQAFAAETANPAAAPVNPDPFAQGSVSDRRTSSRRKGKYVELDVTDAEANLQPIKGWVVDRSLGGLCFSVDQEFGLGTILNVRVVNAPRNTPWIPVEVKRCAQNGNLWELGCKFSRKPSWSSLVLFG